MTLDALASRSGAPLPKAGDAAPHGAHRRSDVRYLLSRRFEAALDDARPPPWSDDMSASCDFANMPAAPIWLVPVAPSADGPPHPAPACETVARIEKLEDLATLVRAMAVDLGERGHREVRLVLDDGVLPSVDITVQEDAGRVMVALRYAERGIGARLRRHRDAMERQLTLGLRRVVEVSVGAAGASDVAPDTASVAASVVPWDVA